MRKQDDGISPRQVLSENLRALLSSDLEGPRTIKEVANASADIRLAGEDMHLSNGKVGRIYKGESGTSVDSLYGLARVFGLEPWQLLVPGLDPKALPRLASSGLLEAIQQLVRGVEAESDKERIDRPSEGRVQGKRGIPEKMHALKEATDVKGNGRQHAAGGSGRIQKPRRSRGP